MLKLRISGTKNDLKTFQKWLKRVSKNDPKFDIREDPEFKQNLKNEKYYRYEVDLLGPVRTK